MKVPLSWLKDYVDITIPVPELIERITIAGLEVESVRLIGTEPPEGLNVKIENTGSPVWDRDKVVIGEVVKVEQHPDADRLTLPHVTFGGEETKQLVTGAPNIKVGDSGQKVVVALTGSVLFDGHAKEKKLAKLKPSKIRGVPSDSMVCSEYELGVTEEHEGIILLEDDAPVGTPFVEYAGDIVLNIDVLPNMARCLSMIGVAREVAALTGQKLKYPSHEIKPSGPSIEGKVRVLIEDSELSARYSAMVMENVTLGKSPQWMQRRLTYAGMRPVNNIVDVTNYVMLEWGQPLHAFDYDKLKARAGDKPVTITVRPARKGETMTTLDDQERKLSPDNLMIADEAGAIAVAGVMGGLETEVTDETRNVLLESASFNNVSVRRTMKAMNLPSEASARFSRGVHPETVRPASERASQLMKELAGATICKGFIDTYPARVKPQVTKLPQSEIQRILGIEIPLDEVTRILTTLEYSVKKLDDETLEVTTPSHRLDIQEGVADLLEDLARIYGYHRLPATLLHDALPEQVGNPDLESEERVRDVLVRIGLQEVINYSMTMTEAEQPFLKKDAEHVRLKNPVSSERAVMRRSVLASVLENAKHNLKRHRTVELFEIGKVYIPKANENLPEERRRLAIVMAGVREIEHWGESQKKEHTPMDFFDLKGVIEGLVGDLHLPNVSYRPSSASHLHPGKSADLLINKEMVGSFGQLHPRLANQLQFGKARFGEQDIWVADLKLESILPKIPFRHPYLSVSEHPVALRDVAVIVEESTSAEQVEAEILNAGKGLLKEAQLFDVYRGESIDEDKKSLAYALTYQAPDRTLTDKEVDKAHRKIEGQLKHKLGAQIRGKE